MSPKCTRKRIFAWQDVCLLLVLVPSLAITDGSQLLYSCDCKAFKLYPLNFAEINSLFFLTVSSHRRATQVFPAVRAVGGVNVVQLPLAPPATLSPRVVCVALEREVGTVSAASLATGTTALLAARVSSLSEKLIFNCPFFAALLFV